MAAGRRHPQGPGLALAAKLGREAHFLLLPRKRIAMALESGQADLLCLYLPPCRENSTGHAAFSRYRKWW
jgi:hypothetical protein